MDNWQKRVLLLFFVLVLLVFACQLTNMFVSVIILADVLQNPVPHRLGDSIRGEAKSAADVFQRFNLFVRVT